MSFIRFFVDIKPHEARAVALALLCNFMLLGSYYILRPVRDAMATVVGVAVLMPRTETRFLPVASVAHLGEDRGGGFGHTG